MIEVSDWTDKFLKVLSDNFGDRVWFVGLQGSYGRGEATENSDIDMVVILDELTVLDIKKYNSMLDTLPNRELMCGFLSGKDELLKWEASDLFQFYYDTKAIRGNLDELIPLIDGSALERAIKIGACNIYHGCVHNMLYEKSEDILKELYKSASFVVQAINFRETGKYVKYKNELTKNMSPQTQTIINTFLYLKNGGTVDIEKMSEYLFDWSKDQIKTIGSDYGIQ